MPSPVTMSDMEVEPTDKNLEATQGQVEAQKASEAVYISNAARGTEIEHELTALQAARKYPGAIGWTVVVCCACVMEGYDTAFIGVLLAEPAFQNKFGVPNPHGSGYQVEAKWQSALTLSNAIGILFGSILNGYVSDYFGMRRTMLVAYVAVTALTFILVFAKTLPIILVGQILCGVPWGIFGTVAPTYASEVCPVVLRGYLGTFINIAFIIGQLVSSGTLRGVEQMNSKWAYDILFAGQWLWPVPLFIAMLWCPESPWWLIRQGRIDDAEKTLNRLFNGDGVTERLAMMIHTHEKEMENTSGAKYSDCFRGTDRRRTEIAFWVMSIQPLSGLMLQGSNTFFFEQAGLSVNSAFSLTIGYYIIGFAGTLLSWFLITYYGRRRIWLIGCTGMTVVLFIIGFVALSPKSNKSAEWAQAVLLVVWVFIYDWSVGPLAFLLLGESSSIRLRTKTVAVGRCGFYLWLIVLSVVNPYMLSPTAGDWKGKTAFVYGATMFGSLIWSYFRLPEFKDRTYEELDILFRKEIPARKFASAEVSAYADQEIGDINNNA